MLGKGLGTSALPGGGAARPKTAAADGTGANPGVTADAVVEWAEQDVSKWLADTGSQSLVS